MFLVTSPDKKPNTKQCSRCKIDKNKNLFWIKKRNKDWLQYICKECNNSDFREYYVSNKCKVVESIKNYRIKNIDKFKEYSKIYLKKYWSSEIWKNKKRIIDSKRRISKLWIKNDDTINNDSIELLLINQDNKCRYCLKDIGLSKLRHLDHIVPLSKWWLHSISNVQWTCVSCNLTKNDMMEIDFINYINLKNSILWK